MLPAALLACAVGVAPVTLEAVIRVESGGRLNAFNRNRNGTYDVGLLQVNSSHFAEFGLTPTQAMEPCTNLRVGSTILRMAYAAAKAKLGEGSAAMVAALSAYNTGTFDRGLGYAAKVYAAAGAQSLLSVSYSASLPVIPASAAPPPPTPYKADPQIFWKVDKLDDY